MESKDKYGPRLEKALRRAIYFYLKKNGSVPVDDRESIEKIKAISVRVLSHAEGLGWFGTLG